MEAALIGGVGLGSSSDWPPLFRPWLKLRVRPMFGPTPGGGGGGLLEGCLGFALDGGGAERPVSVVNKAQCCGSLKSGVCSII